jgi:hypothetical protein
MSYPRCRLCSAELRHTFVDLGMSPPRSPATNTLIVMSLSRLTSACSFAVFSVN